MTQKTLPKFSATIGCYKNDNPKDFETAFFSIYNQTVRPNEIIITVDGPIPKELDTVVTRFEYEFQAVVLRSEQNNGLGMAHALAVSHAKYDWIAIMDADDISETSRFEKQMAFLEKHPEIDVVGGAIKEIDEEGKYRNKTIVYPEGPEDCRVFFAKRNPHAHPAVLFRKSFFDKLNGKKYRPEYRQNQDTMLWYDGMMAGTQHANIPDVVLNFRMTNAMFKKRRNGWEFAKKQFKDRLMINKGLGYGWKADVYGFAMFCMLVSPVWVKKVAYKVFR